MEATVIGTRISASGQTTVPTAVRTALNASVGSTVYWAVTTTGVASVASDPSLAATCTPEGTSTKTIAPSSESRAYEQAAVPAEWPNSFWATLGALDDPSFIVPPDLDVADEAPRLAFDGA